MAHKTLVGGTAYEITGGKTLVGGTAYSIAGGKTMVGGTVYDISFKLSGIKFMITGLISGTYRVEEGTTWSEFIYSDRCPPDLGIFGPRVMFEHEGHSDPMYTNDNILVRSSDAIIPGHTYKIQCMM